MTPRNLSDLTGKQRTAIRLRFGKLEKVMRQAIDQPQPYSEEAVYRTAVNLARFALKAMEVSK